MANLIEFSCPTLLLKDKEAHPIPIKLNIPEWFKHLSGKQNTVKNCMPFLDTLTTGYALKLTSDIRIDFNNIENDQTQTQASYELDKKFTELQGLNVQTGPDNVHPRSQIEGSPILNRNNNQTIQKIIYPFTIRTPKGYSCLFVPPLNNKDPRFDILPGIVDTDVYPLEINFPYTINGDKYKRLDTILKKGLIFAQVIPFLRESWKITVTDRKKMLKEKNTWWYKWTTKFQHKYKAQSWNKKSFS